MSGVAALLLLTSTARGADQYVACGAGDTVAARSCEAAAEAMRPWCHVGVVRNVVDVTANPSDGFRYCVALTENVSKVTCYYAVGEEIAVLTADTAERARMCREAPSPFDGACSYGAQLTSAEPAGLAENPPR